MKIFSNWRQCRNGATAIEYALLAGGIALAIAGVFLIMGDSLQTLFNSMVSVTSDVATKV